jgi:hypothetical protein
MCRVQARDTTKRLLESWEGQPHASVVKNNTERLAEFPLQQICRITRSRNPKGREWDMSRAYVCIDARRRLPQCNEQSSDATELAYPDLQLQILQSVTETCW